MSVFKFVLFVAATYYIGYALTRLAGPFGAFNWLRAHVKTELLECIICLSFWVASLLYIIVYRDVDPLVIFAVAGSVTALDNWLG